LEEEEEIALILKLSWNLFIKYRVWLSSRRKKDDERSSSIMHTYNNCWL